MSVTANTTSGRGPEKKVSSYAILPRMPISWIGPAVFGAELAAILLISVFSGIVYHLVALGETGDIETFIAVGAATFFYFAAVFAYRGNYSIVNLSSGWRQLREVTMTWVIVLLFLLGIAFLLKIGPNLSRGATSVFFVLGWLFMITWRWTLSGWLTSMLARDAFASDRVIVLGDSKLLDSAFPLHSLKMSGCRAECVFPLNDQNTAIVIDAVVKAVREDSTISAIFLAMDWKQSSRIEQLVRELSVIPLPLRLLPDNDIARFLDKPIRHDGRLWAAELLRGPLTIHERAAKRIFDLAVASAGLIALLPLMAIVAIAIKCDSRGPVFFTQLRGGFNGRPFRIFKFRTLTTLDDGLVIQQVCRKDRRSTRVGRVLRRSSIDELPQLLNIVRGEMSLVGPRPHAAAHNSQYGPLIGNYAFRHHVKPGLTGWAQVKGFRGETDVALMRQRVDLDLWYIDNWSLWLDLKIIAKTLQIVLRQPMAY